MVRMLGGLLDFSMLQGMMNHLRLRQPNRTECENPTHFKHPITAIWVIKTVKRAVNFNDFEPLSFDLDMDSPLGHWLEKYRQAKGEQSTRHKSEGTFVGNTTQRKQ